MTDRTRIIILSAISVGSLILGQRYYQSWKLNDTIIRNIKNNLKKENDYKKDE